MVLLPYLFSRIVNNDSMMKKIILSLGVLLLTIALYAQKPFDLKTGDILFQTNKARTSFVKAIENVTTSLDDLNFSCRGCAG